MIKGKVIFESKKEKFPNIQKKQVGDFQVLIGRDAVSNDYLTTIESYSDDLWFHAKGVPGSHVVIRIKDKLPDKSVIEEVAKIAAKNSKCKVGECVVVYCKAKFVTKDSTMNPGQVKVDHRNAEEIKVNI